MVTFDLDFYAFAAWQLREAGRQAKNRMAQIPEVRSMVSALLDQLDAAVPGLKTFRDEMTHAIDDVNADHAQFGDFVAQLLPGGDVRYILDSRFEDHEALEDFFAGLIAILEPHANEGPIENNRTALDSRPRLSETPGVWADRVWP